MIRLTVLLLFLACYPAIAGNGFADNKPAGWFERAPKSRVIVKPPVIVKPHVTIKHVTVVKKVVVEKHVRRHYHKNHHFRHHRRCFLLFCR
jgi:hypothetical protein